MAKRKSKSKSRAKAKNADTGYAVIRVMNPAGPMDGDTPSCTTGCRIANPSSMPQDMQQQLADRLARGEHSRRVEPQAAPAFDPSPESLPAAQREANPDVRFITVPVADTKTGPDELAVIVRGTARGDAIRAVAESVAADAWIDVGLTRSYETKKAALAHAKRIAPRFEMLAERLSRGES